MNWFRVYHDIIDDPKILMLPIPDRWHAIALFCVGSRQTVRGTLPELPIIAVHLRVTIREADKIMTTMIKHGIIDVNPETSIRSIHGWSNRQFASDDVSERSRDSMRRARERSREQVVNTPETDTDTETETETENTPHKPPTGGIGEFVLPDWIPKQDWLDWLEVRKRIRKPATQRAKQLAVTTLVKLRAEGNEPQAVLQQSILHCWQGLFPIRVNDNGKAASPPTKPKPVITPAEEERINARFK